MYDPPQAHLENPERPPTAAWRGLLHGLAAMIGVFVAWLLFVMYALTLGHGSVHDDLLLDTFWSVPAAPVLMAGVHLWHRQFRATAGALAALGIGTVVFFLFDYV